MGSMKCFIQKKKKLFKNSFFFFIYVLSKVLFLNGHLLYDALTLVFHAVVIDASCQMLGVEFHGMSSGGGWNILTMEYLSRNRCYREMYYSFLRYAIRYACSGRSRVGDVLFHKRRNLCPQRCKHR